MIMFIKCPIVGTGTRSDAYRPKVRDISAANPARVFSIIRACIKSKPEGDALHGHPLKTWAVCIIRGPDLSDVVADIDCVDLLAGLDIDDSFSVLKARLKAKKLNTLSGANVQKLRDLATACEVDQSQFVGTDSVFDVVKACFAVQDGDLDGATLAAVS